ncbi:MAG: aminotransferase class I/II-fold pyridoxal phosphate-dependent enzyme, partial [candidate division Zixibacteria bacterium]
IRMTTSLLALSLLNPDDVAAYPDPGPQYFRTAICLADATPHAYSLVERSDFIPNIPTLTEPPISGLRMLFISYPHNPSASSADLYFYRDLLKSIKFENILVVSDSAYIHPGDPDAPSVLQVKGSKKKAIEIYSFSTAFGIDGLGYVVGHRDVISILDGILSALEYRPDVYRVELALAALERSTEIFAQRKEHIGNLRDIASSSLKELGWRIRGNDHTPFLWINPNARSSSLAFARRLITRAGVRLAPGTDFGEGGEGWLRLALCPDEKLLSEALDRISRHSKIWQRKYKPE